MLCYRPCDTNEITGPLEILYIMFINTGLGRVERGQTVGGEEGAGIVVLKWFEISGC